MDNIVRSSARKSVQAPGGRPAQAASNLTQVRSERKRPAPKWLIGLIIGAAGLLLIGLGWAWFSAQPPRPKADRYQAVFLDDGKVFFGRLDGVGGEYLSLSDAYYTQSQPAASDGETNLQPAGGVNLVKVGDEVYGPENSMIIRADQVLFWQNLTTDNQIVKAIEAQED